MLVLPVLLPVPFTIFLRPVHLTCVIFPSETGRRTHPAAARKESIVQGDQGPTPGPADGI